MDNLISRQKVLNTVFSMLCRWDTEDPDDLKNMLLLAFQELPAVDAVPVIRCKYCKHHGYKGGIPYCSKQDYGYGWEDNDFCSKGDRKDG